MPNNENILLKHVKTIIDSNTPVSNWKLDPEGIPKIHKLITNPDFSNIDLIITSTEYKAQKTARIFNQDANLDIISFNDLRELNRDQGEFEIKEGYNELVKKVMRNTHQSFNNWETADSATIRFTRCIDQINNKYNDKRILIVSHGIVINLYLASIRKNQNEIHDFWMQMDFCDYAIVTNSTIIKDIVNSI